MLLCEEHYLRDCAPAFVSVPSSRITTHKAILSLKAKTECYLNGSVNNAAALSFAVEGPRSSRLDEVWLTHWNITKSCVARFVVQ